MKTTKEILENVGKNEVGDEAFAETRNRSNQAHEAPFPKTSPDEVRDQSEKEVLNGRLAISYRCARCGTRAIEDPNFVQAQIAGQSCSLKCACGIDVIIRPAFQVFKPDKSMVNQLRKKTKGGIYVP